MVVGAAISILFSRMGPTLSLCACWECAVRREGSTCILATRRLLSCCSERASHSVNASAFAQVWFAVVVDGRRFGRVEGCDCCSSVGMRISELVTTCDFGAASFSRERRSHSWSSGVGRVIVDVFVDPDVLTVAAAKTIEFPS